MGSHSGSKSRGKLSNKVWICRILLTLNVFLMGSGLFRFIEKVYELKSPLVSEETTMEGLRPVMWASLSVAVLFLPALWLYFYRRHTLMIILTCLAVLTFYIVIQL